MKADVQITLEDDEVFGVLPATHRCVRENQMQNLLSNPFLKRKVARNCVEGGQTSSKSTQLWLCGVDSFEVRISQRRESTSATMCATHATVSTKSVQKLSSGIVSAAAFLNESNVGSKFHCICIGCKGRQESGPCYSHGQQPMGS